jgi:hypothetical protein
MTSIEGCHDIGMATIKEDVTHEITPAVAFRNQYYHIMNEETSAKNDTVLFEPKSDIEPKITLQQDQSSSTLLSKLSKTTAPMRAKLSRSKSKEL